MRIPLKHQARRVRGSDSGGWAALPPLKWRYGALGKLLGTRGSLTAALRQHGDTTVTVLHQRLGRANRDERGLLGAGCRRRVMVREVVLHVDGQPWVFAHTVANLPAQRLLRRAGRRPLATVLFTDPKVIASGLHYRQLPAAHALSLGANAVLPGSVTRPRSGPAGMAKPGLSDAEGDTCGLPARRALFIRGRARLVVTEVFLRQDSGRQR